MEHFQSNLLTLEALDSELAAEISRITPSQRVQTFPSKSGPATVEVTTEDARSVLLHSRFDPVDEAAAFVRGVNTEEITVYVVLGFGLGYHIKALLAAARRESRILVIERDAALFRAALEAVDLREVFASRRVHPIVGKEGPELFRALQPHVVQMFLSTIYIVHRPSVDAVPAYYAAAHKGLSDYIAWGLQNIITTVTIALVSKENALMNLPYYAASPGVARYRNAFKGKPAIVVSAGPSLHRNIETLRRAQGHAAIIAVSTIFKPLLRRGIKPDFAVILDYHPISRKYFEAAEGDDEVVLVVDPKASYEAVEAHRGPKAVMHNDPLHAIIGAPGFRKGVIAGGTTVAHSAFYFAEYIGADPIIFVGQDLAHPDGITHFPGTAVHDIWAVESNRFQSLEMREWESIVRMRNYLRKVKDVHGNDIYTDEQMFSYLQQFELNFYHSKAKVIDATEGGAAKKFTTVMTLAEALDLYAKDPLPPRPWSPPETPDAAGPDAAAPGGRRDIEEALTGQLGRIREVRRFYDRTLAVLKEIQKYWPDQERLAPLLEEINSVREEVKGFEEVNNLVRDIAQAVELRKVQCDRRILSERLDGLDKQKAQLERDLEYVGGFRGAVDQLEKVFSIALERFRTFDFEGRIHAVAPEGARA